PNHPALEALWVLHQNGDLDEDLALQSLDHPGPMVRAWTIRLMDDRKKLTEKFHAAVLARTADEDDAEVRAQVHSTARRLSREQALPLVRAVLDRDLDAADPFIPLMAWYTLESHCQQGAVDVLTLFDGGEEWWSKAIVREHITPRLMRRFAAS